MSKIKTKKYLVGDNVLNVAEIGSGETLLFIHGWSNDWHGWTLLANKLSKHYHVCMIDLPGFGQSESLNAEHNLQNINSIINNFVKKNKLKPKAVVGASMGTIVAASLLETYPKISDTIIELGAIFYKNLEHPNASSFLDQMLRFAKKGKTRKQLLGKIIKSKYTGELIEKYLNAYKFDQDKLNKYGLPGRKLLTVDAYIEIGLSGSSYDLAKFIAKAKHKALFIYGEAEKNVNPFNIKSFFKELNRPNLNIEIIPECGHNPAYEKPAETASLIRKFLQ